MKFCLSREWQGRKKQFPRKCHYVDVQMLNAVGNILFTEKKNITETLNVRCWIVDQIAIYLYTRHVKN